MFFIYCQFWDEILRYSIYNPFLGTIVIFNNSDMKKFWTTHCSINHIGDIGPKIIKIPLDWRYLTIEYNS